MAESIPTPTVEINDQRTKGKDAIAKRGKHFAGMLIQNGLTIDALGTDEVPLRRTDDDRDIITNDIRALLAETANFTVTENPDEVVEEPLPPANNESLEKSINVERACLEAMRQDFDRGIVRIDEDADKDAYQAALKEDKTAGQSWETVQERLLANEASILKKAVELSKLTGDQEGKGASLVGVYKNGELAIRQRSQEIVNARWTKAWQDGIDAESDKGELQLLFHPEAMAQEEGRWAKPVEILRAVEAAGYHAPADNTGKKEGL